MAFVTIFCRYSTGHICPTDGIFGVLTERFKFLRKHPIPARTNTDCSCRGTKKCNINCTEAIHTVVGTKYSLMNKGASI